MGAGITVWNVWDLPVWAWRRYCAEQDAALDEQRREQQEAQRGID